VAAILLEGFSGTSGIIQGGPVFWERIGQICRAHGILLIADEVLSGFGRTGAWFGVNHYPGVQPDLLVMAKGLTSGYVPLGAVMVRDKIADHFEDHTLWAGLTYHAHPLACAAASASIEIIQQESLVARANALGRDLRAGLVDLAERHPSVGDVRGRGLHQVLELVYDRSTREPLSPYNRPLSPAMRAVAAALRENGLSTYVRWNWVFSAPPLVISRAQIQEGLAILDKALSVADEHTA
jgi:taurine--2-oxoglutarate transaminase